MMIRIPLQQQYSRSEKTYYNLFKQEIIQIGCAPPASSTTHALVLPPDVSTGGGGVLKRTSLNRFPDTTNREVRAGSSGGSYV